jgi:predicted nucleic acid-binding protein
VASLIDSSLWINLTRLRSPRSLKQFIAPHVLAPQAALAEPIVFEVLRNAADEELPAIQAQFSTMPLLETPSDLWGIAAELGRKCRRGGISAGSVDLLIVAVAIDHAAQLITFDQDFLLIAKVCDLRVKLLTRPH